MTVKTPSKDKPDSPTTTLTVTDIFLLLAHNRRRNILHFLVGHAGSVSLSALAEQLAVREDDVSRDHHERILTSLYHIHLPKLAEARVIDYDVEHETVT